MNVPAPVDISKLKGILGNAKKLINKVETNDFTTGHIDGRALTEDGVAELQAEGVRRPISESGYNPNVPAQQVGEYSDEQVMNSRLPDNIKKAMLENRIPPAKMPGTFSLNDVQDLIPEEKKMGVPKTPITRPKQVITEQSQYVHNPDLITVSRTELEAIVNAKLLEFFTKHYNKTITEETIKKTITTLIKEGKLSVKKKTL